MGLADSLFDLRSNLVKLLAVFSIQVLKVVPDSLHQVGFFQEMEIGISSDNKTRRNRDLRLRQLPQICSLATSKTDIVPADLLKPGNDLQVCFHSW